MAGIFLFMTGLVGMVLAFILYLLTRKYSWHENWVANTLLGLAGCGAIFVLILVYAKWHG